jgi:hypothetical protein
MLHILAKHIFKALFHTHRVAIHGHKAAVMTAQTWSSAGSIQKHTSDFVTKQAVKGFKFPKGG